MPFFDSIRIGAAGAADSAYTVKRSLRFNGADGPYLESQPSSHSDKKKNTFSFWFKRAVNTNFVSIFRAFGTSSNRQSLDFVSGGAIRLWGNYNGSVVMTLQTSQLFRDFSAWYHFVLVLDTEQGTASNRAKMYVNGVQITDFSNTSYPPQDFEFGFNDLNVNTQIGVPSDTQCNFYIAEFQAIDGLVLDPSYFGETDAVTGQWNPKKYVGSYGTNGFYLNFSDNSGTTATTLGKDSSGNGRNFTPNNFSVADGIDGDSFADTPTNNFCTLNALVKSQSAQSLANGNLQRSGNAYKCVGTFVLKNNKYYFEVKVEDGNGNAGIGVTQADTDYRDRDNTEAAAYFTNGEYKIEGGSQTSGFSTYGNGDIIGVAIDTTLSTPKVWFSKNNTWQGTGDPTTAGYSLTAGKEYVFNIDHTSGGSSTTATAFFGAHKGEFNYTPPTGFVAASSANLPDPTILLPNKHFDTVLYSGNSSTNAITSLNYQPDWVWIKQRNAAENHFLTDSNRGAGLHLRSDQDIAESDDSATFTAFTSNGFSLTGSGAAAPQINDNSDTYVAWNWNAGDTDGKTYTVKVVSDSGNKYRFDDFGTSAVTLDLAEGGTYIFDQSDSSNAGHPLRFYTAADKTGGEYTTGVTTAGTAGSSGAYTQIVVAASAPTLFYQCSVHAGMGGQANTNSTLGSSNFDGSIQSTVKVNASAGFSIVTYTGNGSSATIGHGLGVTPNAVIVKNRGTGARIWLVYHSANTVASGAGHTEYLSLNNTDQSYTDNSAWNDTAPTSTVFSVGTSASSNNNGEGHVAYCFSEVAGYSKFGSYTGNGSSDGTFVFTNFRPAWIMTKRTDSSSDWFIWDSKRPEFNVNNILISPNKSDAEISYTSIDILSNGFKARNTGSDLNANGGTIIYLAFAEASFKNARAR